MWCETCRQDRPGIASMEDEQLIWCARCNALMTGLDQVDKTTDLCAAVQTMPRETCWLDSPMAIGLDYIAPVEIPADPYPGEAWDFTDQQTKSKQVCWQTDERKEARRGRRLLLSGWSCMAFGAAAQLLSAATIGWSLWEADALTGSAGIMLLVLGPLLLVTGFFFYLDHVCRRQRAAESSLRKLVSQGADLQDVIGRLTSERTAVEFVEVKESHLDRPQQLAEGDSDPFKRTSQANGRPKAA